MMLRCGAATCCNSALLVLVLLDVLLLGRRGASVLARRRPPTAAAQPIATPRVTAAKEETLALKDSLLRAFGQQERQQRQRHRMPAVERVVVPEYMWRLYRRQRRANRERLSPALRHDRRRRHRATTSTAVGDVPYTANTIRSFVASTHVDDVTDEKRRRYRRSEPDSAAENSFHVLFNVSDSLQDDILHAAELRVFLPNVVSASTPQRYRVSVFQLLGGRGDDERTRLLDTKVARLRRRSSDDHWVSLDVRPAVTAWQRRASTSSRGLRVVVSTLDQRAPADDDASRDGTRRRLRRSASTSAADRQPLLVTYADDRRAARQQPSSSASSRKRRRTSRGGGRRWWRKSRLSSCRRRQLYVDFAEVEWNDWIIAPPGYQAYVCSGVCPMMLPDHLNATNHAQVQSLLHSVSSRLVPAPCCVPTALSPISMLYVDEHDKVVLRNYRDMVVEACGCR